MTNSTGISLTVDYACLINKTYRLTYISVRSEKSMVHSFIHSVRPSVHPSIHSYSYNNIRTLTYRIPQLAVNEAPIIYIVNIHYKL